MKIPTLPMARGRGLFRTFLIAAVSLFAFAGATTETKAQDPVGDVLEGLAPVLDVLDAEGLLEIADLETLLDDLLGGTLDPSEITDLADGLLDGNLDGLLGGLTEGDLENLLGGLVGEVTGILGGADILGGILGGDGDQELLQEVILALTDTLEEVKDLLDTGELTDDTVLDPLRELLLSVLDIILGVGGEDLLGILDIDDLLPTGDLLDLGILDLDILDGLLGDLLDDGGLLSSVSTLLDDLLGGLLGGLLGDLGLEALINIVIDIIDGTPELVDPEDPPAPTSTAGVDLIAGKRGGIGKGNDIYGTYVGQRFTSKHLIKKKFKKPSNHAFTVENDGTRTDRPTLKGTRNKKYLRIQYFVSGKNRTGAIRTGRYNEKSLAPGSSYVVKVKTRARPKLRKPNGEIRKKRAVIRLKARGSQGSDRAMIRLKTIGK